MSGNKGGITKSSPQRTILNDKEFATLMSRQQYKIGENGIITIIDPVTLVEHDLADMNLNPKPKYNNVRGGKSKRNKSCSKKYKKKTRRYKK